jgi:hypothetical protein
MARRTFEPPGYGHSRVRTTLRSGLDRPGLPVQLFELTDPDSQA